LCSNWTGRQGIEGEETEIVQNTLERGIAGLQSQLTNSGGVSYNSNDVGIYDWGNQQATGVTMATGEDGTTFDVQYTSGTDIYFFVAHGVGCSGYTSLSGSQNRSASFEGTTYASGGNGYEDEHRWGAMDCQEQGLVADAGVNMTSVSRDGNIGASGSAANVTIVWG